MESKLCSCSNVDSVKEASSSTILLKALKWFIAFDIWVFLPIIVKNRGIISCLGIILNEGEGDEEAVAGHLDGEGRSGIWKDCQRMPRLLEEVGQKARNHSYRSSKNPFFQRSASTIFSFYPYKEGALLSGSIHRSTQDANRALLYCPL